MGNKQARKFEEWDTVFWDDPECERRGAYTVTAVRRGWLVLEDYKGVTVKARPSHCQHFDWCDVDFPNWAMSYFINGDGSSLTPEEIQEVDTFVDRIHSEGFTMEEVTDDTNVFCPYPAFGLACDTTRVRFSKPLNKE